MIRHKMGLIVVLLRRVTSGPELRRIQAAQTHGLHGLIQYVPAEGLPCKFQSVPQVFADGLVALVHGLPLGQKQVRLQAVHAPPEENPGVVLGDQHLGVQVGHMLRLFPKLRPLERFVHLGLGCLGGQNLNVVAPEKVPGPRGQVIPGSQVEHPAAFPVAQIGPD